MTGRQGWQDLQERIRAEIQHLAAINASDRRWPMPFCAALASGLPLLVGAYFDHLEYGLVSSLGGMVFLYAPNTPLYHRMVSLMASGFAMSACYTLGVLSQFLPWALVPTLAFIALLVSMVCRFYALGPPGSLFFMMAAAIGAYSPINVLDVPLHVGLLTMGCLLACLIAFFYSIYALRQQAPQAVTPLPPPSFEFVIVDSVIIGMFVGLSLMLAESMHLERPYWVPVSCLAVIQGASLRAVWTKQTHRIAGTAIGLLLTWGLLALPLDKWSISLMMIALAFIIEVLVVRHYGLAAVFITPLTIFLAEAARLGAGPTDALLIARLFDTVLGSLAGLLGGVCLHHPRFRALLGQQLRRLIPRRLLS
ncbi:FUSC family protein [Rhodocyclus gracilis]|uniref:FUSC family protein n=1 Tax=Rhodocyclus tenuis TaxID=1066 RepID=A0A6L5JXC4_RHOTE|nr:FUSC family protein [Rhodocyclus gracilis]MQY51973.1 FUSC family protein [Rhodocyclus gracilis]